MITLTVIGLDPYLVRQISKNLTGKLADIYECSKDDIDFCAHEVLYIHDGVEQNTWNCLVKVNAPLKVKVMEQKAAKIIHEFVKDACINLTLEFYYYSLDNRYEYLNNEYPRFMTESNVVIAEEEDVDEDGCGCEDHEQEEPYLGNIFEGFEEKINKN